MSYYIRSVEEVSVTPKRFRPNGRLHHYVRIYIEPDIHDKESFENIELVQYELHPTFKERIQMSSNKTSNFDIKIWTYGYFKIQAKIQFRDGKVEMVDGFVNW
ncbi:MAG: pYEATS domain-containing protein [Pseudomonadota bacterium]